MKQTTLDERKIEKILQFIMSTRTLEENLHFIILLMSCLYAELSVSSKSSRSSRISRGGVGDKKIGGEGSLNLRYLAKWGASGERKEFREQSAEEKIGS